MIAIEKDIPFTHREPLDTSLPPNWPIEQLEIGDSFVTDEILKFDIIWYQRSWVSVIPSLVRKSFRFKMLSEDGAMATYRIWRTK